MMIGHKPNYYWIVCWVALTPIMVAVRVVSAAWSLAAARVAIRAYQLHPFCYPVFNSSDVFFKYLPSVLLRYSRKLIR